MSQEKQSYIEKQLEAKYSLEEGTISFAFQREKIKLDEEAEIGMLNDVGSFIEKETIFTEDELILKFHKPSYFKTFSQLKTLDMRSRYMFASQLLKKIINHPFPRLHLVVCPDNILIDESMTPHLLHYGVKESLPPYEKEPERLWQEIKAVVAASVDDKYSFEQYLQFNQTIDLSKATEEILQSENEHELLSKIQKQLKEIERSEKQFTKVTKKQWKWQRYSIGGLNILLVPLLIYSLYSLIITQPKQAAFVSSQEHFLKSEYSGVVTSLSNYKVKDMPKVIQYQLALSYLVNESLSESQKDNISNTITLQSDQRYFHYWIYIGRGEPEEALKMARELEDLDLIMYALIHYEEAVKADRDMKDEEKQQELDKIKSEKNEYKEEIKALEEELKGQESEDVLGNPVEEPLEEPAEAEKPAEENKEEAGKEEKPADESKENGSKENENKGKDDKES
ncbi:type VII secretion protein EssB [Cytobacillus purgationiresistens]|uniref:Type VII secretion protein EssB n=1 Tax=Cytobacillus purgationiresistens TaxID=863449 RepID=A0ABU0APU7_9BACI|nr:type VII secretion protein EssB [Cytobacillus purgationiresistens]MDQ0273313.1 type VII secretion protein EssB [Cytobacillus purgationiresistens]